MVQFTHLYPDQLLNGRQCGKRPGQDKKVHHHGYTKQWCHVLPKFDERHFMWMSCFYCRIGRARSPVVNKLSSPLCGFRTLGECSATAHLKELEAVLEVKFVVVLVYLTRNQIAAHKWQVMVDLIWMQLSEWELGWDDNSKAEPLVHLYHIMSHNLSFTCYHIKFGSSAEHNMAPIVAFDWWQRVKDFPKKGQTFALNINRILDNDKAILADDINGWSHKHYFVHYKIQTYWW